MTIATTEPTDLALNADQTGFTDRQVSALHHIGVENASQGDLEVFFHVCKRTGLDPFARQIHMIGRNTKDQRTNQWVTKFTIQTGIDGFRLIGRRAADRAGQTISLGAPEWAAEDGGWRPLWSRSKWGLPIAARVTIKRNGEPFTAVAMFDEYKQTKKDGQLTSMWSQRPAGQLAKCAEALAWRMAFPHDLSGIYSDDEMHQADAPRREQPQGTNTDRLRSALNVEPDPEPEVIDGETVESSLLNTSGTLAKQMFALMSQAGITDRDGRLLYVSDVVGRKVGSSSEMTDDDARSVIVALQADAAASRPDADAGESA